ncbi:MAG: hypothetical protein KDI82_09795 [Gammaproteobacteria bacterium]|nr:hypothetical protein [Gammaproteobacteria bacterium]
MAHSIFPSRWPAGPSVYLLLAGATALAGEPTVALDHFLRAADAGQCIESEAYRAIRQHGPGQATQLVQSALRAQSQRAEQQRALGCQGDIAAQAISAGADPQAVLAATAAGL